MRAVSRVLPLTQLKTATRTNGAKSEEVLFSNIDGDKTARSMPRGRVRARAAYHYGPNVTVPVANANIPPARSYRGAYARAWPIRRYVIDTIPGARARVYTQKPPLRLPTVCKRLWHDPRCVYYNVTARAVAAHCVRVVNKNK